MLLAISHPLRGLKLAMTEQLPDYLAALEHTHAARTTPEKCGK